MQRHAVNVWTWNGAGGGRRGCTVLVALAALPLASAARGGCDAAEAAARADGVRTAASEVVDRWDTIRQVPSMQAPSSADRTSMQAPARPPETRPSTMPSTRPHRAPPSAPDDGGPDVPVTAARDVHADRVADAVLARLGGAEAWSRTRYLTWNFFGARRHLWDRATGLLRIEGEDRAEGPFVVLMNVHTRAGEVSIGGVRAVDPEVHRTWSDRGYRWFINDSYWLLMPYKLRDPGVRLRFMGEGTFDGTDRLADILELTFDGVGVTPQNRYLVYVDRASRLVVRWDFFRTATDEAPAFTLPWTGWRRIGGILLSGGRGERDLTDLGVPESVPAAAFTSHGAVDWASLVSTGDPEAPAEQDP